MRSRLGGLTTAARGHVNTAPAREAFDRRFYAGIPDDASPSERDALAAAARRLYYARLAYRSVRSRTQKAPPAIETPGGATEVRRARDEQPPAA